jgi:hypothetical protein
LADAAGKRQPPRRTASCASGRRRGTSTRWPALRALLDLPFEHVIVSHGEPVHGRAAYERALALPPWSGA